MKRFVVVTAMAAGVVSLCVALSSVPVRAYQDTAPAPADVSNFGAQCVMCHNSDGKGSAMGKSLGVKDLTSKEVQDMSNEDLQKVITNGNGSMPAFGSRLQPDDILGVIKVVRSFGAKGAAPQN